MFGVLDGMDGWRSLLNCGWVLPVYTAVVLAEHDGEVFIFGCEGGEVDIFVVVGALLGCRHVLRLCCVGDRRMVLEACKRSSRVMCSVDGELFSETLDG